jgi:long-chain acyl-CoA synthetase
MIDANQRPMANGGPMPPLAKPDNLVDLFEQSVARHARRPLFGTPDAAGTVSWVTYQTVGRRVDHLRAGMARLGITAGDAVGIIADNRSAWAVCAFATFGLGARFVPMYGKELPRIRRHIIRDAGIRVLFVANAHIHDEIRNFRDDLPDLAHVFTIDAAAAGSLRDLEDQGRTAPAASLQPTADQVAVLIYTSGTTGAPKGVLLSHGNLTSNVIAGGGLFPEIDQRSRSLSILPWAHAYGQTAELYNFIHRGGSIGFIRSIDTIGEDMARVAPTFLIAVPRVFNKIYGSLWDRMNQTGGLALRLFHMGLDSAARCRTLSAQGRRALIPKLKHQLADLLVFKRIRRRFGGRLKGALTASAMMNGEVARFFGDIGLPVFDAYGLTETSPAVTMNTRASHRPGSVGRPIPGVRVVIDKKAAVDDRSDAGEVVVYGPNVMQGYHNRPHATRQVMTRDGGLRTGDLGRLDEDGFLFITGRIKEQYKLENGKYVFPAAMEEAIQLSPWVENVMIYGEGRSHTIGLVVPDFAKLAAWVRNQGMADGSPDELIARPQVQAFMEAAIFSALQNEFGGYERPKTIVLIEEPFSVDNGMLTQTLKLKRRRVVERYASQIQAAYGLKADRKNT